jgi:hypothetical protein
MPPIPPDLSAVTVALATIVGYVNSLEARVQHLQLQTAAIAGEHLRDEDVVPEVIRPGDRLRVSAAVLEQWIDNAGGFSALVMAKEVHVETDGTKTLIVSPIGRPL